MSLTVKPKMDYDVLDEYKWFYSPDPGGKEVMQEDYIS